MAIVASVVLHLAVLTAYWKTPQRFTSLADAQEYVTLGRNLAAGRGFSQSALPPFTPDLQRTPVYPGVLAILFKMTGPDVRAAVVLNVVLGLALLGAVCLLMARHFGAAAAAVSGWLLAVDPLSLVYHHLALTETLFACLLTAIVWRASGPSAVEWRTAAGAGVALGLATLCRPIALLLPPAIGAVLGTHVRRTPWRHVAVALVVLHVTYAAVVGMWVLRNVMVFGQPVVTSVGTMNLYFHRAAYVEGQRTGQNVDLLREQWMRDFEERSRSWTEAEKQAWLAAESRRVISEHPGAYLRTYLAALAVMFGPEVYDSFNLLGIAPASAAAGRWRVASWIHLALVYALAAVGVLRGWRLPRGRAFVVAVAATTAYFLLIGGPEVYARFRMPLMPLFVMIAGLAVASGRSR